MKERRLFSYIRGRYVDPQYPFRDRLYFLFSTIGLFSAGAAYAAALSSGLPRIAAAASLVSFLVMLVLVIVSFCMQDISVQRIICSVFLNFFMFPVLFWVTGGVDSGMMFYFILGLSVASLTLEGAIRFIVLGLSMVVYMACLWLGFRFPELAYPLSYEERGMDTVFSFFIVALFIITVIILMSMEYQKEHDKVLESARSLKQQTVTDNLTGLYNQRYLDEALNHAIASCSEGGHTASIIMLDIDDFKKINDVYGHLRGNQVLCRFAAILKEKTDGYGIAARFGGEEFVILLPGCVREEAMKLADALRLFGCGDGELKDMTDSHFSISGGVAEYVSGISADEWIRRADQNLYAAKTGGKNRIAG